MIELPAITFDSILIVPAFVYSRLHTLFPVVSTLLQRLLLLVTFSGGTIAASSRTPALCSEQLIKQPV